MINMIDNDNDIDQIVDDEYVQEKFAEKVLSWNLAKQFNKFLC